MKNESTCIHPRSHQIMIVAFIKSKGIGHDLSNKFLAFSRMFQNKVWERTFISYEGIWSNSHSFHTTQIDQVRSVPGCNSNLNCWLSSEEFRYMFNPPLASSLSKKFAKDSLVIFKKGETWSKTIQLVDPTLSHFHIPLSIWESLNTMSDEK